ncbi:MAG: single-stranded DNA-binding protein [Thermoleophilia bacterium]|nr:single-stranded DNA-binding protein [Thermoleophilia bacterium]
MGRDIARVTLVGRLSRDPELRQTPNGTSVCTLGVAAGHRYKDGSGQWVDKTSFFDVIVWGAQGENSARYLSKGRQVAIDGRLDQRSWEAQDGSKRSKVEVVADTVVFLGSPGDGGSGGGSRGGFTPARDAQPADDDFKDIDFGGEDDIPF